MIFKTPLDNRQVDAEIWKWTRSRFWLVFRKRLLLKFLYQEDRTYLMVYWHSFINCPSITFFYRNRSILKLIFCYLAVVCLQWKGIIFFILIFAYNLETCYFDLSAHNSWLWHFWDVFFIEFEQKTSKRHCFGGSVISNITFVSRLISFRIFRLERSQ